MSDANAKSSKATSNDNKPKKGNLKLKNNFEICMVNFGVGERNKEYGLTIEVAKRFADPTIDLAKSVVNYTKYFDENGKVKEIIDENGRKFVPEENGKLVEVKTNGKDEKNVDSIDNKDAKVTSKLTTKTVKSKSATAKSDTRAKTNQRIAERTK